MDRARQQSLHGPRADVWLNEDEPRGWCLKATRYCYDIPSKYTSAKGAWLGAARRHGTDEPAPEGLPVFWKIGEFWHVAISVGGGICWSTDIKRDGFFDLVPISEVSRKWGAVYLGWTEDLNGVRIVTLPRNTRWARVRKNLFKVLNSEDALNIAKNRRVVRAFLAATRAGLKKTPID